MLEVAPGDAVGCVGALQFALVVLPLVIALVSVLVKKCASLEKREGAWCLTNDSDFVSILKVSTDT